jgi:hypothetical protein
MKARSGQGSNVSFLSELIVLDFITQGTLRDLPTFLIMWYYKLPIWPTQEK